MSEKWDRRFLGLAEHIASFSKDPSTKVGAVITTSFTNRILSMGFNGFVARGVKDTEERLADRNTKYEMVVHAEINAILFAKCDLEGASLYTWPLPPCARCAALIINAGIKEVISPPVTQERWIESCSLALDMFHEAWVEFRQIGAGSWYRPRPDSDDFETCFQP